MRKVLILTIGLATLAVAGSLLLHFNPLCAEEIIMQKTSLDGRYVAILMSRNCGATTPDVAHINLRLARSQFRKDFFFGTIREGQVWSSAEYSGERFCWSSTRSLEIGYPAGNTQSPRTWHDVTIGDDYRNPSHQVVLDSLLPDA